MGLLVGTAPLWFLVGHILMAMMASSALPLNMRNIDILSPFCMSVAPVPMCTVQCSSNYS